MPRLTRAVPVVGADSGVLTMNSYTCGMPVSGRGNTVVLDGFRAGKSL